VTPYAGANRIRFNGTLSAWRPKWRRHPGQGRNVVVGAAFSEIKKRESKQMLIRAS